MKPCCTCYRNGRLSVKAWNQKHLYGNIWPQESEQGRCYWWQNCFMSSLSENHNRQNMATPWTCSLTNTSFMLFFPFSLCEFCEFQVFSNVAIILSTIIVVLFISQYRLALRDSWVLFIVKDPSWILPRSIYFHTCCKDCGVACFISISWSAQWVPFL